MSNTPTTTASARRVVRLSLTKSEFASHLFPAWMMGRNPKLKIIQTTHTAELSYNFGRKVRGLFEQDEFKDVFPDVTLSQDSKAAGRFNTNKGGEYFAAGVGGAITGRGADLLIIDDPHSEQDALSTNSDGQCLRMVYLGPSTTFATRWCDSRGHDTVVHERPNR